MALNVKVGLIGLLDMLKFKKMGQAREDWVQHAPANEIVTTFPINVNAKKLHPDFQDLVVDKVVDYDKAGAKMFIFKHMDK